MKRYKPDKILVDRTVEDFPITQNILKHYYDIKYQVIDNAEKLRGEYNRSEDPITEGKKTLLITKNTKNLFRKCPGNRGTRCCFYHVMNLVENCYLECSYCFLQDYLINKHIKIAVNIEDNFKLIDQVLKADDYFYRIGSGELSDSLMLDDAMNTSKYLLEYFLNKKNTILELKTKTNVIENLLKYDPQGKVIIAWSLNPQEIIETDELGSATLVERLTAAKSCEQNGYKLAFHFDPIILYDGWEELYYKTIKLLFETVTSDNIVWISLGCLRFPRKLKETMEWRFPSSKAIYHEFVETEDDKLRYFINIRTRAFCTILDYIRMFSKDVFVYLCMEGEKVWKKVFSFYPEDEVSLNRYFVKEIYKKCSM